MPTIDVLDAIGNPQAIEVPNSNGRRSAALSRPVALSTEDLAQLAGSAATLASILAALQATLTVQYDGPQEVSGAVTLEGFTGLTDAELRAIPLLVRDGSEAITRTARHVTSTGSAVQAAAANTGRTYLDLFNGSDTDIWYRFDGTASIGGAGSIQLRPGDRDVYDGPRLTPRGAISTICGASGKILSVWEG